MFTTSNLSKLALIAALAAMPLLYACSTDRNSAVPASATVRAEGNGQTVAAAADSRGTAYVFDATDHKLVWSGEVHAGQSIMVNTKDQDITLDGRPVVQKGVYGGHTYRIFFDPKVRI